MTVTLVFLALLLAIFVGWLLSRTLNVQPWAAGCPPQAEADRLPKIFTTPRVGLAVFLAVITSLFALTISAYGMRMHPGMASDWISVPIPRILWFNTTILVLGSTALQWAWHAAARHQQAALRQALLAGGVLTLAFIAGQALAWSQLNAGGYSLTANPANSFFYFVTALHAAHLLGGLVAWIKTARRVWRGAAPGEVRTSVELCAWYWHYLLVIWVILFGLLLVT